MLVANFDKYVLTGITSFDVDNKKIKIKIKGDHAFNALEAVIFSCASSCISYSGSGFTFDPKRIVHNKEQTLPTTTHNSAPTNLATIICGIKKLNPETSVTSVTPFNALKPFPVAMTIKNGHRIMNGASCKVWVKASCVFSSPTKLASVTVGIPMEPNGVGTPLAIKHTKHENNGLKPNATSMLAGIAIAVPNPAIPSIKPPKHHATSNTKIRLSLETLVIICLMISMPRVRKDKLYVNTAAIMTTIIGHKAIKNPSQAAVKVFRKLCCQIAMDKSAEINKDPNAALYVGQFNTVSANISHKMGHSPRIK